MNQKELTKNIESVFPLKIVFDKVQAANFRLQSRVRRSYNPFIIVFLLFYAII